jgi:predicted O-methyltransferase YrrM
MATPSSSPLRVPEQVKVILKELHQQSLEQENILHSAGGGYEQLKKLATNDPSKAIELNASIMRDKFIALEEDKALFIYQLIRATGALNVIEAGTSYGVSTIYLASAVGQNAHEAGKTPGEARVIATEHEPSKATKAKENWKQAGSTVEPWIDLREGDILETLQNLPVPIDFVLLDSKSSAALPS